MIEIKNKKSEVKQLSSSSKISRLKDAAPTSWNQWVPTEESYILVLAVVAFSDFMVSPVEP